MIDHDNLTAFSMSPRKQTQTKAEKREAKVQKERARQRAEQVRQRMLRDFGTEDFHPQRHLPPHQRADHPDNIAKAEAAKRTR